jgi:outer membrane protein OmpA-like peptidoglycan-associated protein
MGANKDSYFWTSYADLMTSLFFVMLVLFVLTIVLLQGKVSELRQAKEATEQQLEKIQEIEESVTNIDPEYFVYDPTFKRHTLKNIDVSFATGSSDINDIPHDQLERLLRVGRVIQDFVSNALAGNRDVKYLLIIEGQSSKDNYRMNFELSYARALSLYTYWMAQGIRFDPSVCEAIISGSGQESPFRIQPDVVGNKDNQRFVIHIIPKIGEIL